MLLLRISAAAVDTGLMEFVQSPHHGFITFFVGKYSEEEFVTSGSNNSFPLRVYTETSVWREYIIYIKKYQFDASIINSLHRNINLKCTTSQK